MAADHFFYQVEADSKPSSCTAHGAGTVIAVEDVGKVGCGDAHPLVFDPDEHLVRQLRLSAHAHFDCSSLGAVLDGIADQIVEDLREAFRIDVADNRTHECYPFQHQIQLVLVRGRSLALDHLGQQGAQFVGYTLQRELRVLNTRQVEQILDQA